MSGMFHKPLKKELAAAVERQPRPRPRAPPRPPPKVEEDEEPTPTGPYTDFQIMSSSLRGWKYDVMKFESRGKEVDLTRWSGPVKLNRKDYRPPDNTAEDEVAPIELTPMQGPDGKPVIGVDGKIVMVGPDGKVPPPGGASTKVNGTLQAKNGKGKGKQMFKKKTRQVFPVEPEVRQLRREERYPWVLEESGPSGQVWVGHLDDPSKSETYGLLVPMGTQFKFVPMHRWYKFQKRPTYKILGAAEAELEYARAQKNRDPERWLMRKKAANGTGPSEATLNTFKREKSEGGTPAIGFDDEGGTSLRTVDHGDDGLFDGDDDDEEQKILRKRRKREMGQEGDPDENEYSEDPADDDEKIEADGEDEEMKEMEERIKRGYQNTNKDTNEEEEEEEEFNALTGAGKALKKLVQKTEKNEAYDSDDEGNPYLLEEAESDEEIPPVTQEGPAVIDQSQTTSQPVSGTATPTSSTLAVNRSQTPRPSKPTTTPTKALQPPHPQASTSRANSPGLGNAVVAKRATSPKAPKPKPLPGPSTGSRPGSPLASRASSPVAGAGTGSRANSPAAPASRTGSPVPSASPSLKRKATDEGPAPSTSTSGVDGVKPRKKPKRPLDESMIVAFLKEREITTTKDCIQKFQSYLREDENTKTIFTAMVKKVAFVKNNRLNLRAEYQ